MSGTWWERFQEEAQEADALAGAPEPLAPRLLELLADVERAFAARERPTAAWQDPSAGPSPADDIDPAMYSRVTEPERFRIVGERVDAWSSALRERGCRRSDEIPEWALPRPAEGRATVTILRSRHAVATPLIVLADEGPRGGDPPIWTIAAGRPAIEIACVPECGCDACDRGSEALVEEVDMAILSVVDGSFAGEVTPDGSVRCTTSFLAWARIADDTRTRRVGPDPRMRPSRVVASPWFEAWPARRLLEPIDLPPSAAGAHG